MFSTPFRTCAVWWAWTSFHLPEAVRYLLFSICAISRLSSSSPCWLVIFVFCWQSGLSRVDALFCCSANTSCSRAGVLTEEKLSPDHSANEPSDVRRERREMETSTAPDNHLGMLLVSKSIFGPPSSTCLDPNATAWLSPRVWVPMMIFRVSDRSPRLSKPQFSGPFSSICLHERRPQSEKWQRPWVCLRGPQMTSFNSLLNPEQAKNGGRVHRRAMTRNADGREGRRWKDKWDLIYVPPAVDLLCPLRR